jgi:7-carboxy-7-deazaguanine synthase
MSRLRIAEKFVSVQGEGEWMGVPSAFIRVSGCNLRCRWCDTPYASWHPEGEFETPQELADWFAETGVRHAVLTGGEPMLFDPIEDLADLLKGQGAQITIETAGTVARQVACDLMSISPKLANSDPDEDSGWRERHAALRAKAEALAQLLTDYRCQLKFVVDPEGQGDDLAEIDALLAQLPAVAPEQIFLMPEGVRADVLHRRAKLLLPVIMERGWRLGPRLQIDLFGDTRGT